MGPPRTSPVRTESEWPGECHDNGMVSLECRWSTRMGVRGHGFHSVVATYAIENNDYHEACHHDFNFHSHDCYFVEFALTTIDDKKFAYVESNKFSMLMS